MKELKSKRVEEWKSIRVHSVTLSLCYSVTEKVE